MFRKIRRAIQELVIEVREIRRVLQLRQPGPVRVRVVSQGEIKMQVVLSLPTPTALDMGERQIRGNIAGRSIDQDLSGDAVESGVFTAERLEVVEGTLVDVDTSGNRSEARSFSLPVLDTTAPPQPGEVGIRVVSEA